MKLRSMLSIGFAALLATALLGLGGCDPADFGQDKVNIKDQKGEIIGVVYFDINGNGNFSTDEGDEALKDVKVTMTGSAGDKLTATTSTGGVYDFTGVAEDAYTTTFEATGYETVTISGDRFDNNGVDGILVEDALSMNETGVTATVSWGSTSVVLTWNMSEQENGVAGVSAVYDQSADADMTVNFSSGVLTDDSSVNISGANLAAFTVPTATVAAATNTTYTATAANIDADIASFDLFAADTASTSSPLPLSNNTININAQWITPIHGVRYNLNASLDFLLQL